MIGGGFNFAGRKTLCLVVPAPIFAAVDRVEGQMEYPWVYHWGMVRFESGIESFVHGRHWQPARAANNAMLRAWSNNVC